MIDADFLQKALDTGAAIEAKPVLQPGLKPYTLVPLGYQVQRLDERLERPFYVEQTVSVLDAESFTKYFTDYCNDDSRVFVDAQQQKILGVLDYHGVDTNDLKGSVLPAWGKHKVQYLFRPTPEWAAWKGCDRRDQSQVEFARFIEDNLPDIIEPQGAVVLEVARTIEAKRNATFSSSVRTNAGIQFNFEEEVRGTAAKGTLEIPEEFVLALSPFEGADTYKVKARLRYQIKEDKLVLRYELVRPHKVIEEATRAVILKIEGGVKNPVTVGTIAA